MKSFFSILLLGFALTLSGCAFPDGEGETAAEGKIAEDLREARAELDPLMGRWTGVLQRGSNPIDVEMTIQEHLTQTGQRSDGTPIYSVSPRASLSSLDGRYNQTFTGTYLKSTGELLLATTQSPVQFDQIQSLSLILRGNTLSGQVRTPSAFIGEVTFSHQGRQNNDSDRNNEEVRADRLRRLYRPLVGTWQGRVTNSGIPSTPNFEFTLILVIDEIATETGGVTPVLRATYDRVGNNSGVLRRSMNVTYSYTNNPPTLFMTSNNPSGYQLSLNGVFSKNENGTWNLNKITGTHTILTTGASGPMEMIRLGEETERRP